MTKLLLLEICVETLATAQAAERGGADRIELCENLAVGGVTPSVDVLRAVRSAVRLPIFAMVRPRGGDFVYSEAEFAQMARDLACVKACGVDGLVFGLLDADRRVDVERAKQLVELASPLPVTFHRAFDEVPDPLAAMEDVAASGCARILTSGGKPSAEEGSLAISDLVKRAGDRIEILAGGGINAANIERVARRTSAREFHSGLSSTLPYPQTNAEAFEAEVQKLVEELKRESSANSGAARLR